MSWFQSTNFASLAKTALKEAQKTIDKALDINQSEEEVVSSTISTEKNNTGTEEDFFSTWGVSEVLNLQKDSPVDEGSKTIDTILSPPRKSMALVSSQLESSHEIPAEMRRSLTTSIDVQLLPAESNQGPSDSFQSLWHNEDFESDYKNKENSAPLLDLSSSISLIEPNSTSSTSSSNKSNFTFISSVASSLTSTSHHGIGPEESFTDSSSFHLIKDVEIQPVNLSVTETPENVPIDLPLEGQKLTVETNMSEIMSPDPTFGIAESAEFLSKSDLISKTDVIYDKPQKPQEISALTFIDTNNLLNSQGQTDAPIFNISSVANEEINKVETTNEDIEGSSNFTNEKEGVNTEQGTLPKRNSESSEENAEESSPKISSRANSSISVVSECNNEKESSSLASPPFRESESPSFEIIPHGQEGRNVAMESLSSTVLDSQLLIATVPNEFDKEDGKKLKGHTKTSSSNSSSDIEVIPIDCPDKFVVSTTEAETQTDFLPEPTLSQVQAKKSTGGTEKDLEIKQLREEGEKLSKKQFELENVIKKLRGKEKESDNVVKGLKDQLSGKNAELERLMKTFVTKEGIEQSQNESIQRLNVEKRKLDATIEELKSQLEDSNENCSSMKKSLENASIEIFELREIIDTSQRENAELDDLTREKSELKNRNESLQRELDHLRLTLNDAQQKASATERNLRNQNQTLTQRAHELELIVSDVSAEVADATMPLSLEIEKLQKELRTRNSQSEKSESVLLTNISTLESKLKASIEKEKMSKELLSRRETELHDLEFRLRKSEADVNQFREHKTAEAELESQRRLKLKEREVQMRQLTTEIDSLKREKCDIELKLKNEKSSHEEERRKLQTIIDQLQRHKAQSDRHELESGEDSPRNSIVSEASYLEEVFDPNSTNIRSMTPKSFFDSFSTSNAIESLQGQLRMRDVELAQLSDETGKNEKIRKTLNEEIANLTLQNQEFRVQMEKIQMLQEKLEEVEKNYNAVLQMYGEKVEEADELRMDLQDVKEMYKLQIEQLLKK